MTPLGQQAGGTIEVGRLRFGRPSSEWQDSGLLPIPGQVETLSTSVSETAKFVAGELTASGPNDIVEVDFIGAGRGAAVASQAMANLSSGLNIPDSLRRSWHELTLIDPVTSNSEAPVRGRQGPLASLAAVGSSLGSTLRPPIVRWKIAPNIDLADVDFERSLRSTSLADKLGDPVGNIGFHVQGNAPVLYHDVTQTAAGMLADSVRT